MYTSVGVFGKITADICQKNYRLMTKITILHNPRCSKSRETLSLLQQQGIEPEVIEYLKTGLDEDQIRHIQTALNVSSLRDFMRRKEDRYKELNLDNADVTEPQLLAALLDNPGLLERPIVINGGKAALGRPPEQVLEIL